MARPLVTVRDAVAADLPRLQPWLALDAARGLPAPDQDDERWLVAAAADPTRPAEPPDDACAQAQPGQPLAALRLRRAIGLQLPRHWYHVGCVVHAAAELQLFHRLHTLQLGNDHTGASELADIVWDPALDLAAQAAVLQALVAGALQLVAAHRPRYAAQLIVELPGTPPAGADGRDDDARALADPAAGPFWQGLGRHFFAGDVAATARRFGPAWRSHVAALLPRQPVVTAFLSAQAQAAVAQAAPRARVLMQVLWQAGLRYGHHIGVVDGGPLFEAPLDALLPADARV